MIFSGMTHSAGIEALSPSRLALEMASQVEFIDAITAILKILFSAGTQVVKPLCGPSALDTSHYI